MNSISGLPRHAFVALDVAVAEPDGALRRTAAISDSCVTISTVRPRSRLNRTSSSMISILRAVSRFPVGSSAKSTDGSATIARAMATRCICPPDSSLGVCDSHPVRPTAASASRARLCRSRCGHAAIDERQLDVLERGRPIEQVESLEDEAEVVAAQQRALLTSRARRHRRRGTCTRPRLARRGIRGCSWRSTCPIRWTHDRDELTWLDLEVDASERVNLGVPLAVGANHLVEFDQRISHGASVRCKIHDDLSPRRELSASKFGDRHRRLRRNATSMGVSCSPFIVQTRFAPFSAERSAALRTRGTRKEPETTTTGLHGRRRREPERRVGHEGRVAHLRDRDFRRGRHAWLQEALGVVDAQNRLIRHDAVGRLRRAPHFLHLRLEHPVGVRIDAEDRALARLGPCRCRPRRRR